MTIASRILIAIAPDGRDMKALRHGLRDIAPGPLEYALAGLQQAGKIRILDGWVAPVPAPQHPWRQLLIGKKAADR